MTSRSIPRQPRLKGTDIVSGWGTVDNVEVKADGSVGRRVKSHSAVPIQVPIEALNYDAPSFAICGDIRADGGLLPVLNDSVPMARQPMVRRTRAFQHDPHKHGPAGEMGAVPRDTEPLHRSHSPGKSGAPWTTTRPRNTPFHQPPYVEHGPTDRKGTLRDNIVHQRLAGDTLTGKGPEMFMRYEHIPGQGRAPTPRKTSALKAGRGPGMFGMEGLMGPSQVADPAKAKRKRKMMDGPRNIQIGPPKDTFTPHPEYIASPFDDRGGLRDEKAGGGMYVCAPTSKATVPIMCTWDAPNAQLGAPVKRDPRSGRTRLRKGMGPQHGAAPAAGWVPHQRNEHDSTHTGTMAGDYLQHSTRAPVRHSGGVQSGSANAPLGRMTQTNNAPATYRGGVLVGNADAAVGAVGAAGMTGARSRMGGTNTEALVGTYPSVGGVGRGVQRAAAMNPSGMAGGGHLPPLPAHTQRD